MSDQEKEDEKPRIAARERGPGPGRYKLNSLCGYEEHDVSRPRNPAWSLRIRTKGVMFKNDCSPGPGFIDPYVTKYGKDGTPSYSILGRRNDPSTFKTPAPGTYSPEKAHPPGERNAPHYSMSGRTRYRKRDTTPSANQYTLPDLVGPRVPTKKSAAAYSLTGRSKTGGFSEDLSKCPGPGAYGTADPDLYRTKRPAFSIASRNRMPGDNTKKPGPGSHNPETVYGNKKKAPSFSMGIRHSEFLTPLIVDVAD